MMHRLPTLCCYAFASSLVFPSVGHAQIVRGQVVDSVTGVPVGHATITLVDGDSVQRASTLADTEGLFQIQADRAGDYRLHVRSEDYRLSTFPPFRLDTGQVRGFVLLVARVSYADASLTVTPDQLCDADAIGPGAGVLYGVVTDGPGGGPLAGAEVRLSWPDRITDLVGVGLVPDRMAGLTTDAGGRYVACGVPGEVWVTVHARLAEGISDFAAVRFTQNGVALGDAQHMANQRIWREDLSVLPDSAHTARLVGTVTAVATEEPIMGAVIDVPMLGRQARSNSQGEFVLTNLPAGRFAVTLRNPGFEAIRRELRLQRGQILQLPTDSTGLTEAPVALSPIVVEAEAATRRPLKDFWRRREWGLGDFLTREEFERLGDPQTPVDVLRRMHGVRVTYNSNYQQSLGNVNPRKGGIDERRWVVSSTRSGPRSISNPTFQCPPLIFVDNLYMGDPWYVDVDQVVSLVAVAAVEVYNASTNVPLELSRPGSECGAIVFWTR